MTRKHTSKAEKKKHGVMVRKNKRNPNIMEQVRGAAAMVSASNLKADEEMDIFLQLFHPEICEAKRRDLTRGAGK